jgi:hypothetical protein
MAIENHFTDGGENLPKERLAAFSDEKDGSGRKVLGRDTQKLVGPGQDCEKATLEISVHLFNRVINRPTEMLIQLCSRDAKWLWY